MLTHAEEEQVPDLLTDEHVQSNTRFCISNSAILLVS